MCYELQKGMSKNAQKILELVAKKDWEKIKSLACTICNQACEARELEEAEDGNE